MKYKKTLKGAEKRTNYLKTLGLKEIYYGELLEFSFCLLYSRLGAKEAEKLKMTMGIDKKSPKKNLLSLVPK